MASSGSRTLCSHGSNPHPSSVTCDGCNKSFCDPHYTQHKAELKKQLKNQSELIETFSTTLNQTTYNSHSLINDIARWREESIAKINRAAGAAIEAVEENLRLVLEDLKDNTDDMGRRIESSIKNEEHMHHVINGFEAELVKYQEELQRPSNIQLLHTEGDQSRSITLIQVKHQPIHKARTCLSIFNTNF